MRQSEKKQEQEGKKEKRTQTEKEMECGIIEAIPRICSSENNQEN